MKGLFPSKLTDEETEAWTGYAEVSQLPCGRAWFELRTDCTQVCALSLHHHWAPGMYARGRASLLSRDLQVRGRDHLCQVGKKQRRLFEGSEIPVGIWKMKRISPGGKWKGEHIPGAENQQESKQKDTASLIWLEVMRTVRLATSSLIPLGVTLSRETPSEGGPQRDWKVVSVTFSSTVLPTAKNLLSILSYCPVDVHANFVSRMLNVQKGALARTRVLVSLLFMSDTARGHVHARAHTHIHTQWGRDPRILLGLDLSLQTLPKRLSSFFLC